MHKSVFPLLLAFWTACASAATAQNVVVFADSSFKPALDEFIPVFAEQTGFAVVTRCDSSDALLSSIQNGDAADLFLPAGEDFMRKAMEFGLVDVALKRNVLALPADPVPAEDGVSAGPNYTSAAVLANSAQRLQAMALLEFLSSDAARAAFARQGFGLP